jgi:hypothetical protein
MVKMSGQRRESKRRGEGEKEKGRQEGLKEGTPGHNEHTNNDKVNTFRIL